MAHFVEISPRDLEEIADFCNRNFEYHSGKFEAEFLYKRIFDDPHHKSDHGFCLREKGKTVGVMIGVVRDDQAWLKLFGIDQRHRRYGFGSMMLAEIETLFESQNVKRINVLNSSPHYIFPGLDVRYTEAFCFLQANDYKLDQYVHNMEVDLRSNTFDSTKLDRILIRRGIRIKRLKHSNFQEFSEWCSNSWGESWTTESINGLKNDPVTTFIAVDQNLGICGFASYDVTMFRGTFGPTGVDKSYRGFGLGKALMLRCLQDMKDRGYPRCEIAWVGPISFYAHNTGAKICSTFAQGSKELK